MACMLELADVDAIKRGYFKTAFTSVIDDVSNAFSIYGTPVSVLIVHELVKTGVTQVGIGSPIGPKKEEAIKLIAEKVILSFSD